MQKDKQEVKREMILEAQEDSNSPLYVEKFPFMNGGYKTYTKKDFSREVFIYPIQRNGFCLVGDELNIHEWDLDKLKEMSDYGKLLYEKLTNNSYCEDCGCYHYDPLTLGEVTMLLWDSKLPKWLYEWILQENYMKYLFKMKVI